MLIAISKHHHIPRSNLAHCAIVPASVDKVGFSKGFHSVKPSVVLEAHEVDRGCLDHATPRLLRQTQLSVRQCCHHAGVDQCLMLVTFHPCSLTLNAGSSTL